MSRSEVATDEPTLEQLETLAETVADPAERREVRRTKTMVDRLPRNGPVRRVITTFSGKDKAEAFVGSVVIGMPLLVEDGVIEIGAFLATTPAFFVANVTLAVALVVGILYVADFREVRVTDPYFGVVPRRPVWVLGIASATETAMMTMWGRITWDDPWVTLCQVSVVFTAMAMGVRWGVSSPARRDDRRSLGQIQFRHVPVGEVRLVVEDDLEATVLDQAIDLVVAEPTVTLLADERDELVGSVDDGRQRVAGAVVVSDGRAGKERVDGRPDVREAGTGHT